MDISISSICELAVEAMRASGYMESTIGQYRKYFGYLEAACDGGMYDQEAIAEWVAEGKPGGGTYCANVVGAKKRVADIVGAYWATGRIDLSVRSWAPRQPIPEAPQLLDALLDYDRDNHARGLAKSTCDYYWRLAREFAVYLEGEGIVSLDDAMPRDVLGFLSHILSLWPGIDGRHLVANFRPFLKYMRRQDLVDALRLAALPKRHGITPTISDADEEAVALVCCDRVVPARDAAITLLALTTGMRACDIINLKIGDVDWRASSVTIMQQKTGNPLTVPLAPAVAEALAEYVLEHRPDTDCPNVFVRTKAPHAPYLDHSAIYAATSRTLRAAGVSGGGTLLLRHNAASRMLRSGAALPVISAVLGHAEPDSTNAYMEADDESMRSCVLPLPEGAVAK